MNNGHRLLAFCILCLFGLFVIAQNEKKRERQKAESRIYLLHADAATNQRID